MQTTLSLDDDVATLLKQAHKKGQTTLGFLRGVTSLRIFKRPETINRAWRQVEEWLNCGNVWIPNAGSSHGLILGGLLRNLGGGSKLIPDADLAALAFEQT